KPRSRTSKALGLLLNRRSWEPSALRRRRAPDSMERKSGIVVITGRPNAGKSTLLNRILGIDLSIVTPKPQTTREGIKGILSEPQGQIVFVDTPGVHRAREAGVNAFMMAQVDAALDSPDLVWYLLD